VRTALELIAAQAPAYLPWVSRAVHDLVLLNVSRSSIDSGSVENAPGLIYLAARDDAGRSRSGWSTNRPASTSTF
jgi:HEXXH motif-containing protein